jgi:hypothetical protein
MRYNLLAALQVSISAGSLALLYWRFGSGDVTAVYLVSISVVSSIQLLCLMSFDQFVFHYHRNELVTPGSGARLYRSTMLLVFVVGGIVCVPLLFSGRYVVAAFAGGFSTGNAALATSIIQWVGASLPMALGAQVIIAHLGATERYAKSYLLAMVPQLAQALALGASFVWPLGIVHVAICFSIGNGVALLLGSSMAPPGYRLLARADLGQLKSLVADSVKVRAAHNIHNFSLLYILNIFVSGMPTQYSPIFLLAKRVSDTILAVVVSPLQKIMANSIGKDLARGQTDAIFSQLRRVDRRTPALFFGALMLLLLVSHVAPRLNLLDAERLSYLRLCLLLLIFQAALIAMDLPYSLVVLAASRSSTFYISNSLFLVTLVATLLTLSHVSTIWPLPLALSLAQVVNFLIIRRAARRVLAAVRAASSADTPAAS